MNEAQQKGWTVLVHPRSAYRHVEGCMRKTMGRAGVARAALAADFRSVSSEEVRLAQLRSRALSQARKYDDLRAS